MATRASSEGDGVLAEQPPRSTLGKGNGVVKGLARENRLGEQLSHEDAGRESAWQIARQYYRADRVIEVTPSGYNRGGLLVEWKGLPGFVPASQLIDFPHFHLEGERLQHLEKRQNEPLQLKIIELDEETNRLIFSERASQVSAQVVRRLLHTMHPGERRWGTVTNLTDFGAFVDLGGVEGLIHISQLSWRRLFHPSDVVQPGDRVEVLVLAVDEEEGRVALSRKQLWRDPWPTVEERYAPGQIVEGEISNVVHYGAFTLVEQELEGLIHVSELRGRDCHHPTDVLHKGDIVRARVLAVSADERRLTLSLRGLEQPVS